MSEAKSSRSFARAELIESDGLDPDQTKVLARFKYDVPPWLKELLDSVLESMVCMDVEVIPNCEPDSDTFRDHFFLELVLRLAQDVDYETTASFLAEAMGSDGSADTPRHRALRKAIYAFLANDPAKNYALLDQLRANFEELEARGCDIGNSFELIEKVRAMDKKAVRP